jgi:hypothetical protein
MRNNVYNAVCYDGMDAYCIKVIADNEDEVYETFKDTDLKVVYIDFLNEWDNLDEHIKGALEGKWKLADGDEDMAMAIKRVVNLRTGMDLLGQFA